MPLDFEVQCLFCHEKINATSEPNKDEYEFDCQKCNLKYICTHKFLRFNIEIFNNKDQVFKDLLKEKIRKNPKIKIPLFNKEDSFENLNFQI